MNRCIQQKVALTINNRTGSVTNEQARRKVYVYNTTSIMQPVSQYAEQIRRWT